jgi:hypothetical protein
MTSSLLKRNDTKSKLSRTTPENLNGGNSKKAKVSLNSKKEKTVKKKKKQADSQNISEIKITEANIAA